MAFPLHDACRQGLTDDARMWLDRGIPVDQVTPNDATPLYALRRLESGRDGAGIAREGWWVAATPRPLTWIVRPHPRDERRAARRYIACQFGHVAPARLLLDRGADVNLEDSEGETALFVACENGRVDVVRLLLDRGADVDRPDSMGTTSLNIACYRGYVDVARMCIEGGADVEKADHDGQAPLYLACLAGRLDVARVCVVEGGADINRTNNHGRSPHDAARNYDHPALAAWLARVREAGGWTRYISEPRYKLVVLRAEAARGLARRRRADLSTEQLLDFLFPGDRPRRARRSQPRLPDELFTIVARYYWADEMSAEEEAAAAEEEAAAGAQEEPESGAQEESESGDN